MKKSLNEKEILKTLQKYPYGINVREISRKTEISRPTTIKILKKFEEEKIINYPKMIRGKESKITLRKITKKRLFRRIQKQEKILEEKIDEHIIFEHSDGNTLAGQIDDCEGRWLDVYNVHVINDHNKWEKLEGFLYPFDFQKILKIYEIKLEELNFKQVTLDDILKLWINPEHQIVKGINCEWGGDIKIHSKECDSKIHESLSTLYKIIVHKSTISKFKKREADKDFKTIIEHIILNGGKIPIGNQ